MGKKRTQTNKLRQAFQYYKPVFGLLFDYKKGIAVIFLCMLFSFVIGFIQPFASQKLVDIGLVEKDFKILSLMCIVLMLLYVIHALFDYIKEKKRLQIYNNIRFDLEVKSFRHLSSIRIDYFKDKNISAICQTIKEDILNISSIANSESFAIVSAFLGAIGGGAALLIMEWRLYLLTLLFLPINGFLTFYMMNKNMPILNKYLDKSRDYSEVYGDYINGIKVIRLFGLQRNKELAIRSRVDELKNLNMDQSLIRKKNDLIQGLVMNFFSISIYFVSGLIMLKNDVSVGKVVAFETYALMLSQPIIIAFSMIFEFSALLPSIKRHLEFMNYPEEASDGIESFDNGDIIFDNVSFSYDGVENTFSDLSFRITKGSKTVILGKNGCGKTDINACKGAIVNDSVLAMIHNNSDYHIEASVAENNISKLSAGMKVRVKTAATGDEELDGVVASISNYGNNNDNSVNYSLFIDLLDKDKTEGLMMNMTANISIIEDVVSNIYAVPYDAVLHDDGGDYVLVAVPHKDHYKLKRADVEKGTDSNFLCEINGKELKEGELVVIMPKDCNEDDIVDVNIE